MATIDDFGGAADSLGSVPLGGQNGWAAAVRDAIKAGPGPLQQVSITPANGWGLPSGPAYVIGRARGACYTSGTVNRASGTSTQVFPAGTIPADLRPPSQADATLWVFGPGGVEASLALGVVDTDGGITIAQHSGSTAPTPATWFRIGISWTAVDA